MPSSIIVVPLTEGAVTPAYTAPSRVQVSFYHASEAPGDLVISTKSTGLSTSTGWPLPRQQALPAMELAAGTQIFAMSLSGNRTLVVLETPIVDYALALGEILGLLRAGASLGKASGGGAGGGGGRAAVSGGRIPVSPSYDVCSVK